LPVFSNEDERFMSAIAGARHQSFNRDTNPRAVALFTRVPLVAFTIVLIMIAFRYMAHPVDAAAAAGIAFTSPGGITVARVGFAGFPLAFAAFFTECLFSQRRILFGLRIEVMLLGIVMGVRLFGMLLAHSAESARLLIPEMALK
jgi:hypothetical protein